MRGLPLAPWVMDPNFRKARHTPQRKTKAKGGKTFVCARAEVEKYKAAEYKLKHEINQGLWLKKSDVAEKAFMAARLMRDSLLNIPARISALVSVESDQNQCFQILNKELKSVLDEYVSQLKALGK